MRLFVAVELSEPMRAALRSTQLALTPRCPDVRWTAQEQLHLTVKFLGEVGSQDVERVGRALLRAAEAGPRFSLRLAECGCFPQRGPVRIVWSRAEEVSGALDTCVEAVETELATLGFLRENRPFAAHITLGRVREDRTAGRMRTIVEQHSGEVVEQEISSLTLMSSVLSPQGARYEAIQRVKLGA